MIVTPPRRPRPGHPRAERGTGKVARALTLLSAFRYAFAGVGYLLTTQRNAKIHCAFAMLAVLMGLLLRISRTEWLALVLTITLVLTMEGVNTAVEAVVDLASPGYHPLAKIAKDVAAGTVLLAAIGSVVAGLLIFVPHLWPLVRGWLP